MDAVRLAFVAGHRVDEPDTRKAKKAKANAWAYVRRHAGPSFEVYTVGSVDYVRPRPR